MAAGLAGWGLRTTPAPSAPPGGQAPVALASATLITAGHRAVGTVFLHGGGQQFLHRRGRRPRHLPAPRPRWAPHHDRIVLADRRLRLVGQSRTGPARRRDRRPADHHGRHDPGHRNLPPHPLASRLPCPHSTAAARWPPSPSRYPAAPSRWPDGAPGTPSYPPASEPCRPPVDMALARSIRTFRRARACVYQGQNDVLAGGGRWT
jgi:hypothetical protein